MNLRPRNEYAVAIPTRNRDDILWTCIDAFCAQTQKPSLILLVDNNDDGKKIQARHTECEGVQVETVDNDYDVPGIIQGDQTALRVLKEKGFQVAARWDDDLIPEPDCMEKLVKWVSNNLYVGMGGMYPPPNNVHPVYGECYSSMEGVGDGNPRHLQFFNWEGEHRLLDRHFLYSSFVYDVRVADQIGGFCTDYSQHSYRADTDFTLRLAQKGQLGVDTSAVAVHYWEPGGTRDIEGKAKNEMQGHDLSLFESRMTRMGINPNY